MNCVAYKLCYYKFGQMETEYHKPPGYDRARGKEVEEEKSCCLSLSLCTLLKISLFNPLLLPPSPFQFLFISLSLSLSYCLSHSISLSLSLHLSFSHIHTTNFNSTSSHSLSFTYKVGRKNIELSTMEEAFTSEHWIVRIFKVLKRYIWSLHFLAFDLFCLRDNKKN